MGNVKRYLQTTLKQLSLYHRLKASPIYDLYWRIADRRVIEDARREIDFYRDLLIGFRSGDLILDVGANHGRKTGVFLKLGAQVVAVEPDEVNQEILRESFLNFRWARTPVVIVGKAVSDKSAVETMWIDEPGSAKNTLSSKWVEALRSDDKRFGRSLVFARRHEVKTVTLDQLFAAYGDPFFVKIDVEGYELNVLRGMRRPVPYLSFEVNLPEFRSDGLQCIELLDRLATNGEFNYVIDGEYALVLQRWLCAREFSRLFEQFPDQCIEVIWKTPSRRLGN
jgi:FkbM family methyltransferase